MMARICGLLILLPLISAVDWERLERIRQLHEHEGIDTATVHVSYSHSPSLRRLTKREAVENLLPTRHEGLKVKVTLNSTGRVLDLHLQASELQIHGAMVKVRHEEGHQSEFRVEDEGCHYQGVMEGGQGVVSVHFCDGAMVGGAHIEDTEYHFHPHNHRLPHEVSDDDADDDDSHANEDPLGLQSEVGQDLYHILVSWTPSTSLHFGADGDLSDQMDDCLEIDENEDEDEDEDKNDSEEGGVAEGEDSKGRVRREATEVFSEPEMITDEGTTGATNTEGSTGRVPIAEFGVIVDEEFLRDCKYLYPTRQDIIRYLMIKYTGVQALYGNPEVTGFNLRIHVKLLYLWYKNPPEYGGSNLTMGGRMVAGRILANEDPLYKATDAATLFTSRADSNIVGIAYGSGTCSWRHKTHATRRHSLIWNTVAHEFGHSLGLSHKPLPCMNATPPFTSGFMNDVRNVFQPCYGEFLNSVINDSRLRCLFEENVNISTSVLPLQLSKTFPVLKFGLNHNCRSEFRKDSTFALQEDKECGWVLCSVTDEANPEYGMSQKSPPFEGMHCGTNGELCLKKICVQPDNYTTVIIEDTMTGSGMWAPWSPYASQCTSACGTGVQISKRECSNPDRAEACLGPRHRARLCNTQPCPGDDLKDEREIREDRGNYTCSLLHARGGNLSQHLQPYSVTYVKAWQYKPISIDSCLVRCVEVPKPAGAPAYQRREFGTVMQADGTVCGAIDDMDRNLLNVTTRCLRGRCLEFGCDGYSMESREAGKVLDMCGVCGGNNDTCTTGQKTIRLSGALDIQLVTELPAGTSNILFAVVPDSNGTNQHRFVRLEVRSKDDTKVMGAQYREPFNPNVYPNSPLHHAGTYWTMRNTFKVLRAPGPIDRPMRIHLKLMNDLSTVDVVVAFGYTLPSTVPSAPTCENGGVANSTNGGCMCTGGHYGRQCEYSCGSLCYNGEPLIGRCTCDCSMNPRTENTGHCKCLSEFVGPDCSQCAIPRCYNGGVQNTTSCQCQCPPGCQSKPDCSDCHHNPLLPSYRGQYGRGSLEAPLMGDGSTTSAPTSTSAPSSTPVPSSASSVRRRRQEPPSLLERGAHARNAP